MVDRDLTPPDAVVVHEVVVGVGGPGPAGKTDRWLRCDGLVHDAVLSCDGDASEPRPTRKGEPPP